MRLNFILLALLFIISTNALVEEMNLMPIDEDQDQQIKFYLGGKIENAHEITLELKNEEKTDNDHDDMAQIPIATSLRARMRKKVFAF